MASGFKGSNYIPKRGSEESKAISKLKRMNVYNIMNDDPFYYKSFDDVWYAVAHETDMYEEIVIIPNTCQAVYNEYIGTDKGLTYTSYNNTLKWLEETKHLVKDEVA